MTSYVDCREQLAHLLPDELDMSDLQSKLSETSTLPPFTSSSDQRRSHDDDSAPDHSLNTWSAQMATRMLGSVPRRMSQGFKRKHSDKLHTSFEIQQPLLQQQSRIDEVALILVPILRCSPFCDLQVNMQFFWLVSLIMWHMLCSALRCIVVHTSRYQSLGFGAPSSMTVGLLAVT